MRTTLTLDPDVAERLKQEMRNRGLGLKDAVNNALRRGLNLIPSQACEPFRVEPHDFQFNPGVDLDRLNQLVDELESQEYARRARVDRS